MSFGMMILAKRENKIKVLTSPMTRQFFHTRFMLSLNVAEIIDSLTWRYLTMQLHGKANKLVAHKKTISFTFPRPSLFYKYSLITDRFLGNIVPVD